MEQFEVIRWGQSVAAALRALRGVAGLSQAEASRRAGIARTSYRLYEEGERHPDAVQLAQIAEAFGVPFSRLAAEIEMQHHYLTSPMPDPQALAAYQPGGKTDRQRFRESLGDDGEGSQVSEWDE